MSLSILAAGHYCDTIDGELPVLKALVKEAVGQSVRRIDRFIQLALIGAGRAAASMPADGGIYLASGCGDVEITVELLEGIYRHHQAPKPLSFVNSVSNAASYYVAQCLGLHGPSIFVTSRYFAMESALHTAALDLEAGRIGSALVGVVDGVLSPLPQHRERLLLPPDTPLAEASFWLQVSAHPGDRPVLAQLDSIGNFPTLEAMLAALPGKSLTENSTIAFSQFVGAKEKTRCLNHCNLVLYNNERTEGHFESRSAEVIYRFIESGIGKLLLVSGDRYGRYQLMVFSKSR